MRQAAAELSIRFVERLKDVPAPEWDRLANPRAGENAAAGPKMAAKNGEEMRAQPEETTTEPEVCDVLARPHVEPADSVSEAPDSPSQPDPFNPFISHAFLSALEESGSVGGRTGWSPCHVLVEDRQRRPLAAAPAYIKSHSQGEYVFDHAFAEAYARVGGRYYPKIQVAVPFTPVPGRRLLISSELSSDEGTRLLSAGLEALRAKVDASSVHLTFLAKNEAVHLQNSGYITRYGQQFHFHNLGYSTFEDFLAELSSRKRKSIKRERRDALANNISIELITGADLQEMHWDAFFAFYMDTGSRKWGRPYLNRVFFSLIGERLRDRILLIMAKRSGRYIAGALNLIGDDALYGRNWGCLEDHPFLHFEACYYQAIDFAIARGLSRVEAGAQGEHKLARGYRPVTTFSSHDFAHAGLKRAVADYLAHEKDHVEAAQVELDMMTPFRRN